MCHVSAQGVDELMKNVHYHYYLAVSAVNMFHSDYAAARSVSESVCQSSCVNFKRHARDTRSPGHDPRSQTNNLIAEAKAAAG